MKPLLIDHSEITKYGEKNSFGEIINHEYLEIYYNKLFDCGLCKSVLVGRELSFYLANIKYDADPCCSGGYIYLELLLCNNCFKNDIKWIEEKITKCDYYDVNDYSFQLCTKCGKMSNSILDKKWHDIEMNVISKQHIPFTFDQDDENPYLTYANFVLCPKCYERFS